MKRKKEEAEKTRELIIDSAIHVFKSKGYSDATLKEIAEHAGLTRGAIYHHFSDKAELFKTMAEIGKDQMTIIIDKVSQSLNNPVEIIKKSIYEVVKTFQKDKKMYEIHEIILRSELSENLDFMKDFFDMRIDDSCKRLNNFIEQGISENLIKKKNKNDITKLVVIFFWGLLGLSISHPETFNLKKDIKLIDLMFEGILK